MRRLMSARRSRERRRVASEGGRKRATPNPFEHEIKLNSTSRHRGYAARKPFAAHGVNLDEEEDVLILPDAARIKTRVARNQIRAQQKEFTYSSREDGASRKER